MRDWISSAPELSLTFGGLAIGFAFGWFARSTGYCLMGAVASWRASGDKSRLAAAAVAAAVAILGAHALEAAGVVDLSRSMYASRRINWAGALIGGFIFGVGMVYAGGCPSRSLVRAGAGDGRAAVGLLVMAIAAYATVSGVFGEARAALDAATALDTASIGYPTQRLGDLIAGAGGPMLPALLVAGALLAAAATWTSAAERRLQATTGIGIGVLVTLGWSLTGLAMDDMALQPSPPASLSFVKPVADAIDWLERSTALGWPGFAASNVFGVVAGSFASAWIAGALRFQPYADAGDLRRSLFGSFAMGIGGVLGLGCTIGQGVTGVSTLSVQSFIAVAAMLAGAVYGIGRLQRSL